MRRIGAIACHFILGATCLSPSKLLAKTPLASVASSAAEVRASFWTGKTVLLTGASSGLGEALSIELSRRGASLVLAARREDRLASAAAACDPAAAPVAVLPLDVCADAATLEAKAAEATALLGGRVDVLICAAGVGQRTGALDTSDAAHRQIMGANFEGSVALSRALLPPMLERSSGHVCVVSSVQGFFGQPYRSSYAASKAAVFGYFDALRAEVAPSNVKVTTVAPGYIKTDHSASAVGGDGKADGNSAKGMEPADLAAQVADAIADGRAELIAGAGIDARVAVWLRAIAPSALFALMRTKV